MTTDLEVVSYAGAAAWRVTEQLSLGAGVALNEGRALSTFDTFTVDDPPTPRASSYRSAISPSAGSARSSCASISAIYAF